MPTPTPMAPPPIRRGRLLETSVAPTNGERFEVLAELRNTVIEQILSSAETNPTVYEQRQDEFVVVLAGAATLDVGGEMIELRPNDWVVLPAGVPHRVVRQDQGTNWLAVHVHPTTHAEG